MNEPVEAKDSLEEKELRKDRPTFWDGAMTLGVDIWAFTLGIILLQHCAH